ncbi:MAG: DnaD domain protein [Clostridiales bacterium]|nr:DnaD domain protein [Clostridiales bacterium]
MNEIALSSYPVPYTIVPNQFIDQYMADANGEYVKVFLYLLRCMGQNTESITVSSIADQLNVMEGDVLRAFSYWEKQNILTLSRDASGTLTGLQLSLPSQDTSSQDTSPVRSYTDVNLSEVTITDEISELIMTLEMYMGRMMKPADTQLICFLYDDLGFSTELIEHLFDYCISKNKKSPSYIEAVALAWAKDGIDTVEKADASIAQYNTAYQTVSKAFALNRAVAPAEQKFIDKWVSVWGFSETMLKEACSRALLHTGKPDFKYTDRILENWHKEGVTTLEAVKSADQSYNKKQAAAAKQQTQPSGRFQSFSQRNYSEEEYREIEKKLLRK